jgi:hypothetical protein
MEHSHTGVQKCLAGVSAGTQNTLFSGHIPGQHRSEAGAASFAPSPVHYTQGILPADAAV